MDSLTRLSCSAFLCRFAASALALLCSSGLAAAEQRNVQVKSFIAAVDLTDPSQFDSANACAERFQAFAVNCTLWGGEDPADGNVDTGQFRIWSQVNIDAQCAGNKVISWHFGGLSTSFGKEAIFQTSGDISKPMAISTVPDGATSADRVNFTYRVRGQPIPAVNAALASARPRTCTYIWHEVSGSLTCANGSLSMKTDLSGSGFPSHRLWVDGDLMNEMPQGAFKKLWDCDALDPRLVQ